MEDRPVRWVELYAGTGACAYELLAGAKFPTGYQGSSRALTLPTLAAVAAERSGFGAQTGVPFREDAPSG